MFYLFKIVYSSFWSLINKVSQYTVRQEKAYLSVSNLLLGICLILDLFEYRPQNDLL